MDNPNEISDVVSEFKNESLQFNMDQREIKDETQDPEENSNKNLIPDSNERNFKYLSSRSSSTNTSYQDLPSLNFMDHNKSELINTADESNAQIEIPKKTDSNNYNPKYSEFLSSRENSEHKFSTMDNCVSYDVKKDIDSSKVYVEQYCRKDYDPTFERYQFKEDFYSLCKQSPRLRKSFDIVSDSFESARCLKEPKFINSDYNWDAQRYNDFRYERIESTPVKSKTTISAFETDPDLLLLKNSPNNYQKETLSPLTKKYLAQKNVLFNEPKTYSRTEFESDFLDLISLRIKKNGVENFDEVIRENSFGNETIESEHLFSDYAKGPVFPSEVYGSRPGIDVGKEGIYTRKKKDVKITEREVIEADASLDAEKLKQMDKKLKKFIKKNLKEDLKSHIVNMELNQNVDTISWEIPVDNKKYSNVNLNETTSTICQSVPYLPLRDVPVHELVKKLRHEFEQEGDLSCVPNGLNDIYEKFHGEYTSTEVIKNSSEKPHRSEKNYQKNLESLVKNPALTVLDNLAPKSVNFKNIEKEEEEKNKEEKSKPEKKEHDKKLDEFQETISKNFFEERIQKHEKRIKKLENFIKSEKLQLQQLKKVLKLDHKDALYLNLIESYALNNNESNEEDLENLENFQAEEKLEEILNDAKLDANKSQIENQISDEESSTDEETDAKNGHEESGIESSESSSEKLPDKKTNHNKAKISSWFCPLQPVKSSSSEPKIIQKSEKKPEKFEIKLDNNNVENADPYSRKIGLQEAFQVYNFDFLKRSRNRVKEIKIKAARRQVAKDLKLDSLIQLDQKLSKTRQFDKQRAKESIDDKKLNYFTIDKAMFSKNRHIMSSQEIVQQTKKKYQNLPEVQQKKLRQKLEENKIRNRLKSNIFKKAIQQRVLSSGPNFNLNFKALENQI
ncbi:unnamed protein product [Brachionus calyciflorus]|uniref:ALMS motif domain-containing protein n=1 Tax=Brachionus calyciflorus TaxID=104777 RepID=A0A813TBY1_9BILA|nr:unnamed protein product [Brachionus calyciflorus]